MLRKVIVKMTPPQKTFTIKSIFLMLLVIIVVPFLPLVISWRWDWWEAWVYAIINLLGFIVSRLLAARRNPDIIKERARYFQHEDAISWDKLLSPLVGLGGGMVPLVVGLDARFGWSPVLGSEINLVALLVLVAGFTISSYALIENGFFSGVVRIQRERGHHLVSGGPYRWVRHPGYAGALLVYLATPLFLDSLWAILPVIWLMIILVIRTALEDNFLKEELAGYREYTQEVRYRLVPGIW